MPPHTPKRTRLRVSMSAFHDPQHRSADGKGRTELEHGIAVDGLAREPRSVATGEVLDTELAVRRRPQACMFARDVAVDRDARGRDAVVAPNRDLVFKGPRLAVQRAAQNLEDVHGRLLPLPGAGSLQDGVRGRNRAERDVLGERPALEV